ncbi:hypothetical protein [Catellatospora methionotrophica]|uniref:hypothetical protein n=1 Tax=Catellatospora methionotrophica TaxID=121620 RepID=UPI003404E9BB
MNGVYSNDDMRTVPMARAGGRQYAPAGPGRRSRLGTWYPLMGIDGGMCEGLLVPDLARRDALFAHRVAEHVRRTAARRLPGVIGVVDFLLDEQYAWLITDAPPGRMLAHQLSAEGGLPADTALAVAADTARLLLSLHTTGSAHGDPGLHNLAVDQSGQVLLTEAELTHVFAGTAPDPGHDAAGWVRLLGEIDTVVGDQRTREALAVAARAAASAGGTAGITAGLQSLAGHPGRSAGPPASVLGDPAAAAATIMFAKTPPPPSVRPQTPVNAAYPAGSAAAEAETVGSVGTVVHRDGRTRLDVFVPEADRRMNHLRFEPLPPGASLPPRQQQPGRQPRRPHPPMTGIAAKLPSWIRLDLIGSGLITAALVLVALHWSGRLD